MAKIKSVKKNRCMNLTRIGFMIIDALSIAFTYLLTISILWLVGIRDWNYQLSLLLIPVLIVFKLIVYYFLKLYHLVLVNVGLDEVFRIAWVVSSTNFIIILITLAIPNFHFIYEIFFVFTTLMELALAILPRILRRLVGMFIPKNYYASGNRTLIVGAGSGGKIVLNELRNNPNMSNHIVGFIDDDETKIGNIMSGYPIFGPISEISRLIERFNIEEVIIGIVNIEPKRFQEIINYFIDKPIKIKRLPAFKDYEEDLPERILDVNVEDLLSREVIELDSRGIGDYLKNKKIMVTGAGGSIGSELVRQIIKCNPKSILMVDIYENGVYDLNSDLRFKVLKDQENNVELKIQIASVYNYRRMKNILVEFQPDIIFHAAAYKHVPLMEDSPMEAVRTNILGTYNMCKLADEFKVKKFVLVSSDKAVRPTNVMGATKRFAEMIVQSFNRVSNTNYSAVRFGNVLGSNGSVVPLFKYQIANGGPVTVTDENIIRYFMTIPEAVGLILQSAVFAGGGEIFILDMGEPVKVIDLAEKMIMLSGFKPYVDMQIKITGLRPGEKLFEELLVDKEKNIKTENKLIFIEQINTEINIEEEIKELLENFENLDNIGVKRLVRKFVSTYTVDELH